MIIVQRLTVPATLPVSLEEAKHHARVDDGFDDASVQGMIEAATAERDRRERNAA